MARQLRIPQGRLITQSEKSGCYLIEFDAELIKASKTFAKLKKDGADDGYTDEEILYLIIGHIAEGVV